MNVHSRSPVRLAVRRAIAMLLTSLAALTVTVELWRYFGQAPGFVIDALLGGLVAAAATALGTLPVALSQRPSERTQDAMFGFGAGVMLAASAFSLVLPGIEAAQARGLGVWQSGLVVGGGILLGAAVLMWMERHLPHEHFIKGVEGSQARRLRRTWLFVFAIALHNVPEGLAIGVAFAGDDASGAAALSLGIAVQDVPEGLVVAMALMAAGYKRTISVLLGMATGLVEPVGAALGAIVVGQSASLLPWGLGFAAGAMIFVVSHEIIPESHRKGHEMLATTGLMIGFVVMMLLDTALG